tara:strand:- start:1702 stop:2208 length:507 start_codon:yes stop_codon:yes gene_type:complete
MDNINDIIDNLDDGITIRGDLIAECILYHGKNIENRKRKINKKYLALHIGSGKINKDINKSLLNNIEKINEKKLPKSHIVGIIKLGESKTIDELTDDEKKNKWIFEGNGYNVCNYITDVYILDTPIKCRGFQSVTWNLKCVDKDLIKKNKFELSLKQKIINQLLLKKI